METPLISVIVPVYKVERYLRRCLDSIINQTYKNLEIILVDDGSPDNCGAICDEYAEKDSRVRVIHKENGGVSSARNVGLSVATGKWIGWVDPDDWVEADMFEYLLRHTTASGAEIGVCGRFEEHPGENTFFGWEREDVLSTSQALELLLQDDMMRSYLCDKLFRREIFDGITFPEGRTFEDMAVMHRLFERARRVICLPDGKYHYLQRPDGIVRDASLRNRLDHYAAAKQRLDEMRHSWPQFANQMEAQCVKATISIWNACCSLPRGERAILRPQILEMSAFVREHGEKAFEYIELGTAGRAVLRLVPYPVWWSFALARLIGWAYRLKHGQAL